MQFAVAFIEALLEPKKTARGGIDECTKSGCPDGRDRGLLFGKYAGRYLIPPCAKGDKKNGVVEKDYKIPDE